MLKRAVAVLLAAGCLVTTSPIAYGGEDYSYLDDMSINQLKALDAEIHKRIPMTETVDESSAGPTESVLPDGEKDESGDETASVEPITVLDNDLIKIDVKGKFSDPTAIVPRIGHEIFVE